MAFNPYTGVMDDNYGAVEVDGGMVSFEDLEHLAIRTVAQLDGAMDLDEEELDSIRLTNAAL